MQFKKALRCIVISINKTGHILRLCNRTFSTVKLIWSLFMPFNMISTGQKALISISSEIQMVCGTDDAGKVNLAAMQLR